MACLAGATVSFDKAQHLLHQLCGWTVSDETLRHVCYHEAQQVRAWRGQPEASRETFQKADGDIELQIDAAKVNTDTGWRDIKIGIFAKRPAGQPSTPDDYQTRVLPPPSVRVAFCAIEPSAEFGVRTRPWATTLALVGTTLLSVLGDGAEWIWEIAKEHFPGARQLLDLWHALDHVSQASAVLYGPGSAAGKAWQKEMALALLRDGWTGLCAAVGQAVALHPDGPAREALDKLVAYFAKHLPRWNYGARLYKGPSVGSGMVEGAVKTVIGQRLKAHAARWQVGNVELMGELCCLAYSDTWDAYWLAV